MKKADKDKIIRFGERLPDHLIEHWSEIVDIINNVYLSDVIFESESQERAYFLELKLKKACSNIIKLKDWFENGTIGSRRGFNNMCDYMVDDIRKGIVEPMEHTPTNNIVIRKNITDKEFFSINSLISKTLKAYSV